MKKFLAIIVIPVLVLAVLNLCPAIAGIWVDGGNVGVDATVNSSIHGSVGIDNFPIDIYGDLERIAVLALCVIGFVAGWRKIISGLLLFLAVKTLAIVGDNFGHVQDCIEELIEMFNSDVARLLFLVLVGSWLRQKFKKNVTSN